MQHIPRVNNKKIPIKLPQNKNTKLSNTSKIVFKFFFFISNIISYIENIILINTLIYDILII